VRVDLELEASHTVSISSDHGTDYTESDSKYDLEFDPDVDMRMENNVDAPDSIDLDGDVDMARDGHDDKEEDEVEEDEQGDEEVDEGEEKEKDKEEDKDEDDDKEPWTIGQGETVNTSADDVDTMVDVHPIVLPEESQELREHTPRPQPPAPAPRQQTQAPRPRPHTLETDHLSRVEHLGLGTPQKPRPAVPTLQQAEAPGNTSHVDVDQQLLDELADGDSLPNVLLPDALLPETNQDGSVVEECTCRPVSEEAMVVVFGFGSGPCLVQSLCSNRFVSGVDYYMCSKVIGLLRV
jgi:hypothetical protein